MKIIIVVLQKVQLDTPEYLGLYKLFQETLGLLKRYIYQNTVLGYSSLYIIALVGLLEVHYFMAILVLSDEYPRMVSRESNPGLILRQSGALTT